MPTLNVTVIGDPVPEDRKRVLQRRLTDVMVSALGRTRKLVVVSVSTSPAEDWAVGGEAVEGPGFVGIQVTVRVLAGTNSDEQKARMISETTAILREELGEPVLPLYVTFDEILPTAWGYNGRTVAELSAPKAA